MLPPQITGAGQMRLADVVRLCGLRKQNPRATILRLEGAELATPIAGSDVHSPHAHIYELEQAVDLLLACRVITRDDTTPSHASAVVREYRQRQGQFGGTRLRETVVKIALQRFESHVLGRVFGAMISILNAGRDLSAGAIVCLVPMTAAPKRRDEGTWAEARARELLRKPKPRAIGIVGDTHEVVFVNALSESVLNGRRFRLLPFPSPKPGFALVIAEARATAGDDEQSVPPTGGATLVAHELARRLHQLSSSGFERLRIFAFEATQREGVAGATQRDGDTEEAPPIPNQTNVMLWLLAAFACIAARPESPDKVGCEIVMTRQQRPDSLSILASSDTPPWSDGPTSEVTVRTGQLLSGYASLHNVTLVVPETSPPFYERIVSRYSFERRRLGEDVLLTCIAVPISVRGADPSPILYLWMPAVAPNRIDEIVKLLQVLAPTVGELIQRSLDTTHTLRASPEAALTRFLSRNELRRAISAELVRLVAESAVRLRTSNSNERIAFVVLNAASASAAFASYGGQWLAEQFRYLIPGSFLAPWLQDMRAGERLGNAPYGEIGATAALLMVPRWLPKGELDRLRAAIPSRVNNRKNAFTENDEQVARLDVWIVDERWEDVMSAAPSLDALVDRVLDKATAAAGVLEETIAAYGKGFENGDWTGALAHVKAGLAKDPSNPYLLRRAAEFSTYVGNFIGAARYAQAAIESNDARALAGCLLGDAYLGQLRAKEAVRAYDDAHAADADHPLPLYCKGFAFLTVARLLQLGIHDLLREAVVSKLVTSQLSDMRARMKAVDGDVTRLCDAAARALRPTRTLVKQWGTRGLYPFLNFYGVPTAYALCQTELVQRNPAGGITELESARIDFPRDDLIARELLFARMWAAGAAARLLEQRDDRFVPGLLGEI